MKYQEFIECVRSHISNYLSNGQMVSIQPITKNNGVCYDGLTIINPEVNLSPTIYLNPYYHRYLNGVPMQDIYEDIWSTYQENLPSQNFDISVFTEFEKAKQRIVMRLINRKRNLELLEQVPHIPYLDFALVFVCLLSDCMDEYATILIYNNHLNMWNVQEAELYPIALDNSKRLLPYQFHNIEHFLQDVLPTETLPFPSEMNLFLLTNQHKIHGATCIAYPGLLDRLSRQLNSNLIILPSSIHEVLIVPDKDSEKLPYSPDELIDMIREINDTQVADQEVLGDFPYYYNRDTGTISCYTTVS